MHYESLRNYSGVGASTLAAATVKLYLGKQYLKSLDALQELQEFVWHTTPVLNKMSVVSKKGKDRVILDTKASRIKQCSAKYHRVVLPRLLDTIVEALKLYMPAATTRSQSSLCARLHRGISAHPTHARRVQILRRQIQH